MGASLEPDESQSTGGTLSAGRLRLVFERQGDRFAHTLSDELDDFRRLLFASRCAAGGDDHWEIHGDQATLWLDDDSPTLEVETFLPGTVISIDTPGWLVISPTVPAGARWPQTIRWGYRVRLV